MLTSRRPLHGRHTFTWFVRRIALLVGMVAVTAGAGGGAPNQTPIAKAANAPNTFGVRPTDALPGGTVAIFAVNYNPRFADILPMVVVFDTPDRVLATTTMVACDNDQGSGFGTECNGQALNVTIPADATVGEHQLLLYSNVPNANNLAGSATFTVDMAPTPTDTPTETATETGTDTLTVTDTSIATGTGTPTATATATATGTATASQTPITEVLRSTPSPTAQPVALGKTQTATSTVTPTQTPITVLLRSTLSPTTQPIVPGQTQTATPTIPPSLPLIAPSIAVSQLQHVQGGCALIATTAAAVSANTLPGTGANRPTAVFKGGQHLTLDAAHLPANTALDLVIVAPRAVVSGRVSTTVDYSPPVTQVLTDSQGRLQSTVVLPSDLGTGSGTVEAFLHTAPPGITHPTLVTTWGFTGAPHDPILQVSVRDASGKPMSGASVTFFPNGATTGAGVNLAAACGRVSDSSGDAVFSRVPTGSGQVIVSQGSRIIGSAAPITLSGTIVSARVSAGVHATIQCTSVSSFINYLKDEESGVNGAGSGEGPFGTFISGVRTMDSFSAEVSGKLGRNTPITLSFVNGNGATALSVGGFVSQGPPGTIALRAPFVGLDRWNPLTTVSDLSSAISYGPVALHAQSVVINPSHLLLDTGAASNILEVSSTLSVAFPPVDLGRLAPGDWSVRVTLGSAPTCPALYSLKMIKNPWETPFGTIHPIYDRVDHAYYASASLPNSGLLADLLHFEQPPVSIGWNDFDAGVVTIPGVHIPFPKLASSDLGVDVNERLFTNGYWDGSLSAHAHVMLIGVSLLDNQLPAFTGSGTRITRDDVPLFEYPAISDQPLFSQPLAIVPVGFPGVAGADLKVTFNVHGSVFVRLGVGAVLDRITFTFVPSITAGLEASAHADFAGSSAGVSVTGALKLQSPVTVAIPGSIHADLAVSFEVGAHVYVNICYVLDCSRNSYNFPIVRRFCVLGNCNAPNLASLAGPSARGQQTAAGRGAILTMPGSQRVSGGALPASSTTRQPAQGTIRAAPQSSIYPAQPAIAISPSGHSAALWVSNAGGRVRLLAAMDGGPTLAIATSSAQIAGPRVTWIGQNQAIAVWVGNTATASQIAAVDSTNSRTGFTALVAALAVTISHQEIYSAVWDGTSWSAPSRLTNDNFADSEPALTGDIARHTATLAWIHATRNDTLHEMLQSTELRVSQYVNGHWTSAATLVTATAGGVHSPAIGSDGNGQVMTAWVVGSDTVATTQVGPDANGTVQPRTIPGFGRGAVHLNLAFDGDGHPVVAADGVALSAARLESSGRWTVWALGSGSQPQLIAERDGSVALSSLPGTGDPLQPLGVPSLRILPRGGTFGDPLTVPGTSNGTIAFAIAADPRTGAVKALDQTTTAASKQTTDTTMQVTPVLIAAGGQLSLVDNGISLSPPQPRPGRRAGVLVTVRNTGFTTLLPGGEVVVTVEASHITLHLRVSRALAPGATATLVGTMVAANEGMTVTARAGSQVLRVVLALPPAPTALGSAARPLSGGLQLDWAPAADTDVTTYRVYRGVGRDGPLSLAGIASSTQWIDLTRAPRTTYRYQITAVDTYGRESSLSAALVTAAA